MPKAGIFKVGRQLNDGLMYIFTVFELDVAGLHIKAYCSNTSNELTTSPSESELEAAGISRSEEDLEKLINSYDIIVKGGKPFLQSQLTGINKPKLIPTGDGVRQFICATRAGDESLPELLTTGLAELCKAKPAGNEAIRWLGQWLLDHNPNQPRVAECEVEEAE